MRGFVTPFSETSHFFERSTSPHSLAFLRLLITTSCLRVTANERSHSFSTCPSLPLPPYYGPTSLSGAQWHNDVHQVRSYSHDGQVVHDQDTDYWLSGVYASEYSLFRGFHAVKDLMSPSISHAAANTPRFWGRSRYAEPKPFETRYPGRMLANNLWLVAAWSRPSGSRIERFVLTARSCTAYGDLPG